MSWNVRDYRQGQDTGQPDTVVPPTFQDDEPLPTHAYMAGMEQYADDTAIGLPLWQRQAMRDQGLLTIEQMNLVATFMRRGMTEI